MMIITENVDLRDIYQFQLRFQSPWFFDTSFERWKASFEADVDGEGRILFRQLHVKAAYEADTLLGFVQYGCTAFGFDENGEISDAVSYPVVRNLYFVQDSPKAGQLLLNEAMVGLKGRGRLYAFFHYFGMTCFARHGKLFENHAHIEALLKDNGFTVEHENVYYSSALDGTDHGPVVLTTGDLTAGGHQYVGFQLDGEQVGGCEVHYLADATAYLRWIYVSGELVGRGIGTKCMGALKQFLYGKGVIRFDTDTALDNHTAQHYYEKNGFTREGITRSYYKDEAPQ